MDSGGPLPGSVWIHVGSPIGPDDPRRHRGWISYPRVLRRLHAGRGRFLPLFCLFEPVRLLHADAGLGGQLPTHVCWMGGCRIVLLPSDRLLFHAETIVTAGVYMVARSAALYNHAPGALLVIAVVGAFTAIFAASIGLVQTDIKKVLAYSTVSQLGYMFLACGAGAYAAGIFHLMTHAFFKALLFLAAGSVIHGMGGIQDVRKMGGLARLMPWTHKTFLAGTLAISGFPPLAGFFSKDAV